MWVNGTELPGGIVEPDARGEVVAEAERVLRAFRDPATGGPSFEVTRVAEPERGRLGDLFLTHRPGYECRAEAGPQGAEVIEVARGARTSHRRARGRWLACSRWAADAVSTAT